MGMLINKEDFIGKFAVGKTNFDQLPAYINRYEKTHLRKLLGVELFKLFEIAYTANNTLAPTPIYKVIYDPIVMDSGNCIKENKGMKSMVLGLVWFDYVREYKIKMVDSGAVVNEEEVSTIIDSAFMYQRYNESVHDWEVIQWYIMENISDYPKFNGQTKNISHWSL